MDNCTLDDTSNYKAYSVAFGCILALGFPLNAVSLWILVRRHSLKSPSAVFMINLALSDLLLVMVAVPTQLLHYFSVQVDETGLFCKISEYFRVLSSTAAILNLTAVTLERFVVIVYPYHSRSLCTLGNCRKVVTTVWVLSIFLAIPVIWTKVRPRL